MAYLISLITGPFGKIIVYVIAGLVVLAVLFGLYYTIRKNAANEQLLKDQKIQLEQVVKKQNEYIEITNMLTEQSKKSIEAYNTEVEKIKNKTNDLYDFLEKAAKDGQLGADKESSEILKETIKRLQDK